MVGLVAETGYERKQRLVKRWELSNEGRGYSPEGSLERAYNRCQKEQVPSPAVSFVSCGFHKLSELIDVQKINLAWLFALLIYSELKYALIIAHAPNLIQQNDINTEQYISFFLYVIFARACVAAYTVELSKACQRGMDSQGPFAIGSLTGSFVSSFVGSFVGSFAGSFVGSLAANSSVMV